MSRICPVSLTGFYLSIFTPTEVLFFVLSSMALPTGWRTEIWKLFAKVIMQELTASIIMTNIFWAKGELTDFY